MTTEHTCTRHQPGTAACVAAHRCPCQPCRRAVNRQHKRSRLGLAPIIPADTVRAHLQRLVHAGYSTNGIARAAGVSNAQVIYTLTTAKRIQHRTAQRLLAVADPTGRIDGTGTRRRLQALVANGWAFSGLARRLGLSPAAVHNWTGRDRVAVSSAQAARRLYDELWDKPPPETSPTERATANRNRALARRNGWPPPLAWDDDEIDNPHARPHLGDECDSRKRSVVENVEYLADAGDLLPSIALRLGITAGAVRTALGRAKRSDLLARIAPELNGHKNQHTKRRAA